MVRSSGPYSFVVKTDKISRKIPVTQMGNPERFVLFTKEELNAIQWDSLEEEMSRCAEYDIVPAYSKALDLMTTAKQMRS